MKYIWTMLKIVSYSGVGSFVFLLILLSCATAQVNGNLFGGANFSNSGGATFRSSKRIGMQLGVGFTYHFNKIIALQAEPSYNLTRLRANNQTQSDPNGFDKGTKSLQYFNLPVMFKLKITSGFALLGGITINSLLNENRYELNNGSPAFKEGVKLGHSFGLELGKFYVRYHGLDKFSRINNNWNAQINQYQFGMRWQLF